MGCPIAAGHEREAGDGGIVSPASALPWLVPVFGARPRFPGVGSDLARGTERAVRQMAAAKDHVKRAPVGPRRFKPSRSPRQRLGELRQLLVHEYATATAEQVH